MAARKRKLPIIVGPTGIGKTGLVVALADHWPITVLSADSRQVYRGLDVGTAKPDRETQHQVPHLGLDVVDPGDRYSAGRFARDARGWLETLPADRRAVMVGGTGFYVKAFVDGLFHEPPMDAGARDAFRGWARHEPNIARWAARLDPGAYPGSSRQRAARTVEVALLTGRPLSWWQVQAHQQGIVRPWYVRLSAPRTVLHERIERRAVTMLENGWVEEVQGLLAGGADADLPGLDAVGYRDVVRFCRGELDRTGLLSAIVVNTRRYAKRQETWFRHQLEGPVFTLDATAPTHDLAGAVIARWEDERECE